MKTEEEIRALERRALACMDEHRDELFGLLSKL
jgi:hypothetical protein